MEQEGCPPPRFEVTDDSVQCVLPAHPRHARMQELQAIEHAISLGRTTEATESLERLLAEDPYNFRTVGLLSELARSTQDATALVRFVEAHRANLNRFPTAAQLSLADALTTVRSARRPALAALVRELLVAAGHGRMEMGDARRLIIAHLAVQDERGALLAIERTLREHPDWTEDPALLQLRGRTWLQFAKRCGTTLDNPSLTRTISDGARRDFRGYYEKALKDLQASIAHGAVGAVRDHAEDDLRFLDRLRNRVR